MIVTQSYDLRSVTVGRTVVTVEFEQAAKRHYPGRATPAGAATTGACPSVPGT